MHSTPLVVKATNTILYCQHWAETVAFYRDLLKFPITYSSAWFVEFHLGAESHLSVANEARATIKSSGGQGITITLKVDDAAEVWAWLQEQNVTLGPLKQHAWGATVFYFYDPEGHRLEVWS